MSKILIVENMPNLALDIEKAVKQTLPNVEILKTNQLQKALNFINQEELTVIVIDLMLNQHPGSHIYQGDPPGIIIAKEAKKKNNCSQIIVVTSFLTDFLMSNRLSDYQHLGLEYLNRNQSGYLELLKYQLGRSFEIYNKCNVFDIKTAWDLSENNKVCSYWFLLINGIDIKDDRQILSEILIFQSIMTRYEAAVKPYQLNDNYFSLLNKKLYVNDFPALMFSNNSSMMPCIIIKPKMLQQLIETQEGLRKFFIKIHVQLKNGVPIEEINNKIRLKEFWDWVKWGVDGLKEFGELLQFIDFKSLMM